MGILKENSAAVRFLLIFVGLYLLLNTLYGLFTEHYLPQADPATISVSGQVASILSWFDETVTSTIVNGSRNVLISNQHGLVLSVFEGCNGINVMIVFVCFIIAFRGRLTHTLGFVMAGFIAIYIMNLTRVCLLYLVEVHFSKYLYFFHKYLFTGVIYLVVFGMWYVWIKRVSRDPR